MKYTVVITEELRRELEVEAESKEQAYEIAKRKYDEEEIVLDSSDHSDTSFDVWLMWLGGLRINPVTDEELKELWGTISPYINVTRGKDYT